MAIMNRNLHPAARRKLVSLSLGQFTANNTVTKMVWAAGRQARIYKISFAASAIPADADGTMLINVKVRDKSENAEDVIVNGFSAEGLAVAKDAYDATLVATVEGGRTITSLEVGDSIIVELVSNSAGIDTNADIAMTIEYEMVDTPTPAEIHRVNP